MRPNGFSQSSLILLLTLGLSILAHAAVLLWGDSNAQITKLPGQRLQVQVSVASKPPAVPEAEAPYTPSEPVVQSAQPVSDIAQPVEIPPEKPPVPQPDRSNEPVAGLSHKPAPVTHAVEKVSAPAPAPVAVAQVKPEPPVTTPKPAAQLEPKQPVAKVDKPLPPPKPDPVKKQVVHPPVEPVAESEDASPADVPTQADTAMESSQTQQASFQAAQVRKQTKPHYPRLAWRRGQEGTVWLRVQVDSSGKALAIQIDRSSGFDVLDKAAIKAVRSWRFLPALQDGQAQASYVKIPVKFQLDNAR